MMGAIRRLVSIGDALRLLESGQAELDPGATLAELRSLEAELHRRGAQNAHDLVEDDSLVTGESPEAPAFRFGTLDNLFRR